MAPCVAWTAAVLMQYQRNTDVKQKGRESDVHGDTYTRYNNKSQTWWIQKHLACFTSQTANCLFTVMFIASVYCRARNTDCVCLYVAVFY